MLRHLLDVASNFLIRQIAWLFTDNVRKLTNEKAGNAIKEIKTSRSAGGRSDRLWRNGKM